MKIIKIILFFGILGAIVYVMRAPAPVYRANEKAIGHLNKNVLRQSNDYSAFLAKIDSRHIFAAGHAHEGSALSASKEGLSKTVENFRLAGVMTSGGAKAIIEDKKKSVTVYVKEGETFGDNISVEKINNDSVSLSRDGEQAELRL